MAEITPEVRTRLEQPAFWFLATLRKDGSPNVTSVWADVQDGAVLVNTSKGRAKERQVRRDPRVSMTAADPENPYSWIQISGRVVDMVDGQEALDHIDAMAKKYLDQDKYPYLQPGEERVILKIEPEKISSYN